MQQKTDLIFVIRYANDLDVARYQVFTTFYLLALSIPMLIASARAEPMPGSASSWSLDAELMSRSSTLLPASVEGAGT